MLTEIHRSSCKTAKAEMSRSRNGTWRFTMLYPIGGVQNER